MSGRSYMSIGDVLAQIKDDFPDITISKIRFLEAQGLIDPERTPSGYRKFYTEDVARLRWILRQQRDHFLPLRVIKDRLDVKSPESLPWDRPDELDSGHGIGGEAEDGAGELADHSNTVGSISRRDLAARTGLLEKEIEALEQYGLLSASLVDGEKTYGSGAQRVAAIAARFASFGLEARHLRSYRSSVDREVNMFAQSVSALLRQRNPHARSAAMDALAELAKMGSDLRSELLNTSFEELREE